MKKHWKIVGNSASLIIENVHFRSFHGDGPGNEMYES